MDYKKAGVDIEAGYKSVELMKKYVKETMRPEVMGGIGGFSGAFSLSAIKDMEFDDVSEAIPAYLALIMMPLTYSIANGIAIGLIAYTLIKIFTGKFKELNIITVVLSALFVIRYLMISL